MSLDAVKTEMSIIHSLPQLQVFQESLLVITVDSTSMMLSLAAQIWIICLVVSEHNDTSLEPTLNTTNVPCVRTRGFWWGTNAERWDIDPDNSTWWHTAYIADYESGQKMYIQYRWSYGGWWAVDVESSYDWYYCESPALEDCIVGKWYENWWPWYSEPDASVTMVDCDCEPILETLYFDDDDYDLNGLWHYDFEARSYRLNNTVNANNITLHCPTGGVWLIEDESESETIMRCTSPDLKDCSGRWYQSGDALAWYPTSGSMRLVSDCTVESESATESDCDGTGITNDAIDCMYPWCPTLCLSRSDSRSLPITQLI